MSEFKSQPIDYGVTHEGIYSTDLDLIVNAMVTSYSDG